MERGRWPGIHQRWRTASHKRGPIERELRRHLKAHPRFEELLILRAVKNGLNAAGRAKSRRELEVLRMMLNQAIKDEPGS